MPCIYLAEVQEEKMVKRVLVSAGPIPAKLDSVKVLMNKFKGGLATHTARLLAAHSDLCVHVVAWMGTKVKGFSSNRVHYVSDIREYLEFVKEFEADAYVLAAAVANIMPVNPWEGKFPSHEYREGEEFDIRFKIAPRIIDRVLGWHPKTVLVGYKLFDGSPEDLVAAGRTVMAESRAKIVFCNTPMDAAVEKIVVTPEGGAFPVGFDEHVELLYRVIRSSWFSTKTESMSINEENIPRGILGLLRKVMDTNRHGTFANMVNSRIDNSQLMLTTKRVKPEGSLYDSLCGVKSVDVKSRLISHVVKPTTRPFILASDKATMNTPTLWEILLWRQQSGIVIHGHQDIGCQQIPYVPPGTIEEVDAVTRAMRTTNEVYVQGHGFYKWFFTMEGATSFVDSLGGA
jgi:hypothetical protein